MKVAHLSQAESDRLLAYFGQVRDAMRLSQWDILLMQEQPDDEDVILDMTPVDNHFTVQVRISRHWASQPVLVKQDTVVHELIHCMHRDVTDIWFQMTHGNTAVSVDVNGLVQNAWRMAIERMVSHLARLISPTVPAWPGDGVVRDGVYVEGAHR